MAKHEPHNVRLPGDPLPTYEELLSRIEKLESKPLLLNDLPLTQLQSKLENDWQPSPGVLLPPASITGELLAQSDVTFAREIEPLPAWTRPTLAANWTTYVAGGFNEEGYYKRDGRVYLRGMIKKSIAVVIGETIFTLPVGFRPPITELMVTISNTAIARCDVTPAGAVQVQQGNAAWFSLDNLSFRAA